MSSVVIHIPTEEDSDPPISETTQGVLLLICFLMIFSFKERSI